MWLVTPDFLVLPSLTLEPRYNIIKDYKLKDYVNVLKWASYDSDFKPNTLDTRFRLWAKKGITAYCTITDKGQLLDFNSLKEKFNLVSKDFFRYLQLRQHFCQKIKKATDGDPNKSALVKIFSSAYKAEPMLKTITKLYRALMDMQ